MILIEGRPTRDEIVQMCRNMEQSLLAAHDRGNRIRLAMKTHSYPVYGGEGALIDAVCTGTEYLIQIGSMEEERPYTKFARRFKREIEFAQRFKREIEFAQRAAEPTGYPAGEKLEVGDAVYLRDGKWMRVGEPPPPEKPPNAVLSYKGVEFHGKVVTGTVRLHKEAFSGDTVIYNGTPEAVAVVCTCPAADMLGEGWQCSCGAKTP
jgi:hypothetical protein